MKIRKNKKNQNGLQIAICGPFIQTLQTDSLKANISS